MIIITKGKPESNTFYPIYVIANNLPDSQVITYSQLNNLPLKFFQDNDVIFHIIWGDEFRKLWMPNLDKILQSKSLYIEFDADGMLTSPSEYDYNTGSYLFINKLAISGAKFIWEAPMEYNPFQINYGDRLQLKCYDERFQRANNGKTIDILGYIGNTHQHNTLATIDLLDDFHSIGKNVVCITRNNNVFDFYSGRVPFKMVHSDREGGSSQNCFWSYLDKAKVFLDLSYRMTTGRIVYDALYFNSIGVCSDTYGASKVLFPEYTVDAKFISLGDVRGKVIHALDGNVEGYIQYAKDNSSISKFIQDMRKLNE